MTTDRRRRVLIFPAGTEIGLEIFHALEACKDIDLYTAGADVPNHSRYLETDYEILPSVHEDGWLSRLQDLCRKKKIDYVYPAHDEVVLALSRVADSIPATVVTSPRQTCEISRSKRKTYEALQGCVPVPEIFPDETAIGTYPVFVKPDRGQGSLGAERVDDPDRLAEVVRNTKEPLISEFLPGPEYTVDCFSDRKSGLMFCAARLRERARNGIAVNTATVELPEARGYAEKISNQMEFWGAWFFQAKRRENGELVIMEVAPRVAGSMITHRVRGINFALLSIYEAARLPISILDNHNQVNVSRALASRFKHDVRFDVLYIDLDDTLVLNRHVHIPCVELVYRCVNNNKKIVLLTRHDGNLPAYLKRYRLTGLFDEIIHIGKEEKKSKYINGNAIFVDDSFSERMDVHRVCGVPTFDSSMIEMLTASADW